MNIKDILVKWQGSVENQDGQLKEMDSGKDILAITGVYFRSDNHAVYVGAAHVF